MHAELNAVAWPTVFITVLIALAIVLVARRKKASNVARRDSVQYIFTATVKARHPGVTYLDFPAPPPPNRDHGAVGYGPTILRTFGRTLTKLRFSNEVEADSVSGNAASSGSREHRNNRLLLQVSGYDEGSVSHANTRVTPHSLSREERTAMAVPTTNTLHREATPGPSTSRREPTVGPHREPVPGSSTVHRDSTPGPAPGSSTVRRDPTPGPSTLRRNSARAGSSGCESHMLPSADAGLSSFNSDGEPSDLRSVTGSRSSTSASNIDDATPQLARNKRFSGKIGDGPDAVRVLMFWWETTSSERIDAPPDLSRRQELRLGDLFLHRHDGGIQIWIWSERSDEESRHWKKIPVGYVRVDGRILAFTEVNKQPSWLDPDWHSTRRRQCES